MLTNKLGNETVAWSAFNSVVAFASFVVADWTGAVSLDSYAEAAVISVVVGVGAEATKSVAPMGKMGKMGGM